MHLHFKFSPRIQKRILGLGAKVLLVWMTTPSLLASVFLSDLRIEAIRQKVNNKSEPTYTAYLKLQHEADGALTQPDHAPSRWYVPGFYKDPAGQTEARKRLADDANAAYALALTFRIRGDKRYAEHTLFLLKAWAQKVGEFSQKDDSALTFSYHFPAMIFAAALLENYPGWTQEDRKEFRRFVREKALPMNTMERSNNWGNWGLVLVLASATYLQDEPLFTRGVARWKYFMDTQIAPDGTLPLEVTRNNGQGEHGLWYTNFTLMPQTLAAEIIRGHGIDLYGYTSPSGASLQLAFHRIVGWTATPATFPYYRGPSGQGPIMVRSGLSYWEILNNRWPDAEATKIIDQMRPLSNGTSAPYLTLTHGGLPIDE